jgi:hypothetical protein
MIKYDRTLSAREIKYLIRIIRDSFLKPMLASGAWAEELYLDTACTLLAITEADLGQVADTVEQETAYDVLENSYAYFNNNPNPLAERMHKILKSTLPEFPPVLQQRGFMTG